MNSFVKIKFLFKFKMGKLMSLFKLPLFCLAQKHTKIIRSGIDYNNAFYIFTFIYSVNHYATCKLVKVVVVSIVCLKYKSPFMFVGICALYDLIPFLKYC